MNCYNHPSVPAVAICKNCYKGLCHECLKEVKNGIACKATCVDEVKSVNALINNLKKLKTSGSAGSWFGACICFALFLFLLYASFVYPDLKLYILSVAAIFFIGGVLYLVTARRH